LVILTHPHSDHVVGLNEVLKRYAVKKVLYTGVLHTSPDYLAFLKIIKDQNINNEIIKAKKDLILGPDLKLEILFPLNDLSGQKFDNLNNTSIVMRLIYQDFKVLLTGDAEAEEEKQLIASGSDLQAQVLKVGHHGSRAASSDDFLALVRSEAAVIQCGKDNDFGHPHLRTLKRFLQRNMAVYRNDLQGQVKIISHGRNYQVLTEK
jgi:competence protein ComEC